MTLSDPRPVSDAIPVRILDLPTAQGRVHQKILLLKLDCIGDFITALDAFRILRHAFAGAEITLICLPSIVELAKSTGLFNKVKGFDYVPEANDDAYIARFKALLDEPYFLAADFRHDPFNRFGLDYVDSRYRAAFAAATQKGLDVVIPTMEWNTAAPNVKGGKNMPVHAEVRLTLLAHAIVESLLEKSLDPDLFHVPEDLIEVISYRNLETETRMKIGLSVGAGSVLRKWDADKWGALLRRLTETYNPHFVFFGGEADKGEIKELAARLSQGCYTDLTGLLFLDHLPAYMNLLDAYIGCDTGLTHVAGNLGVPTVNIFAGVSNVSVWRARGPKVKTIYAEVTCSPCHKRFREECPYDNICMSVIEADMVFDCFETLKEAYFPPV